MNETRLGGTPLGASGGHVDIVDDDASVRRALARLLHSVGLQSAGYSSARRYLEAVDLESRHCLLLDIHLPEMSGTDLLEHLRKVAPKVPVICMTGGDDPDLTERLATVGAPPCLRKPFDEAELFEAMAGVTDDATD